VSALPQPPIPPQSDPNARIIDRRLFFAYIVCSLATIFYLPTLVPVSPSVSTSYLFGYNNRVGVLLLFAFTVVGAVWTRGLGIQFSTSKKLQPVPLKVLAGTLAAAFCGCVGMYMAAGRFGGFGESRYQIDRVWLLSQGKIPYVNFEWPFGVSFLYVPLLLRQLLDISLVQACYLFWILNILFGILLLFVTVNLIDYPTDFRTAIFLLVCGAGLPSILGMGIQYAFLRFTLPLFLVLLVCKLFNRGSRKWEVYSALFAVASTIILLSISPETAISQAFACACIFALAPPSRGRMRTVTLAGVLLAFAGIFLSARAALLLRAFCLWMLRVPTLFEEAGQRRHLCLNNVLHTDARGSLGAVPGRPHFLGWRGHFFGQHVLRIQLEDCLEAVQNRVSDHFHMFSSAYSVPNLFRSVYKSCLELSQRAHG